MTRLEESVLPQKQSDTASYRARPFISLTVPSWICSGLKSQYYLIGKVILQVIEQRLSPAKQCYLGYLGGYVEGPD